jgi:hypothetical protein
MLLLLMLVFLPIVIFREFYECVDRSKSKATTGQSCSSFQRLFVTVFQSVFFFLNNFFIILICVKNNFFQK